MKNRLTDSMTAMLKCAQDGRGLYSWARGRSQRGGATATEEALKQRGLLSRDGRITDEGRKALDETDN